MYRCILQLLTMGVVTDMANTEECRWLNPNAAEPYYQLNNHPIMMPISDGLPVGPTGRNQWCYAVMGKRLADQF